MRKTCFSLVVLSMILLMVNFSFAEVPRAATSSEGKTSFTNIAVTGLDRDGTDATTNPGIPGYIEMTSSKGDVYYLYVDYDGKLRIASEAIVGRGASPNTTGWYGSASAHAVGTQIDYP